MSYLSRINSSADLRKLSLRELNDLAGEIREEIIRVVTRQGGHLSPNLGVVELTLALHYVFNTPEDKLIWDVGHQCYTHKIITGRRHLFSTLRQYQGLSGFPKREESEFDVFDSGHSGDAIGVGVGMATALRLAGKQSPRVIVVIGDGSLASGVAFEGLNYCGQKKLNIIIILNDNEMSIARSDGALATYLNQLITGQVYNRLKNDVWNLLGLLPDNLTSRAREMAKRLKEGLKNLFVPSLIFEELGFRYFGPLDGHNLKTLINTFHQIKILTGPILVHVVTKKGKGYPPAEEDPEFFHGIGGSVVHNRCPLTSKERSVTFSEVFGSVLLRIAERDPKVVVITPGMCLGSGLRMFRERFPGRFFDCGICEQFALNFASGLALSGLKPVVAIYSPFLPRAYDQLIYNICLQNLPVLFAIDRAGVSGEDGETHQGIFDLSFLRFLPNITIIAPKDGRELETAMTWAIENLSSPIAIRYPKGLSLSGDSEREIKDFAYGKGVIEKEGKDFCLIGIGYGVNLAHEVAKELEEEGYSSAVVNARFVKPLDGELFSDLARRFSLLFTIEENTFEGGFGSALLEFYEDKGLPVRVIRFGLPSTFLPHGDRKIILRRFGLEAKALAKRIKEIVKSVVRDRCPLTERRQK